MLSLGAFAFAAPGMLALLLALPVIYWLLRLIPPLPKLVRFPAIRLLVGLEPTEQTPMKMPWWLLLLRLLLAAALILAVARPLLNPQADLPGRGPLLLVIDDGWSSAPGWTTRIAHAERLIQRAERGGRTVVLMGTAPAPIDQSATRRGALRPDEIRTTLRAFRPKPWPTDRAVAATELDQMQVDPGAYVVWLSDGLEDEGAARLTERLRRFDGLQVVVPDQASTPLLLLPPVAEGRDLKVRALRPAADGPRKVAVQAADEQGRVVARIDVDFAATATQGEGVLPAPAELRNRMARLDIEAQGGAGSAILLDERHRRRPVAIMGERATAGGQPLLQEVYFLERALDPYVSLSIGDLESVLTRNTAVLLIPDGAVPSTNDREEIARWIERGGIAVRFAGANLAAGGDTLVPTRLRLGDRALGGVMSWGEP
ncbi:MAG: BatA domain-containing protein, partial [Pseudomonadota bacterium]